MASLGDEDQSELMYRLRVGKLTRQHAQNPTFELFSASWPVQVVRLVLSKLSPLRVFSLYVINELDW